MQTDIVQKAGINPKTLLSSVLYWQKLEGYIGLVLYAPYLVLILVSALTQKTSVSSQAPTSQNWVLTIGVGGVIIGIFYNLWAVYVVPRIYVWRVHIFAQRNNLKLLPKSKLVALLPDSVRRNDIHNVQAVGCELPVAGRQVTVFDYTCVVGTGKSRKNLTKGLAVLQLQGDYPHLFLDSKKNGKNHTYSAEQKVKLEGNFSKYFDVYMPEGSQAGALTVFAPDMMQTILDTGKLFDVEIRGKQAVIISSELVFTKKVLPFVLSCVAGLSKEFKDIDRTWQPVFTPSSKQFRLKGQPLWRVLIVGLAPLIIGLGFSLLPENIRHPIKAQPAQVIASRLGNVYSRDDITLARAHGIAVSLNAYTAKHSVPDSLSQANITNNLDTIIYTKLLPDRYQFCTTYQGYINGNGPTRASGNIRAYYGATVDSPNLPATLEIVEWHDVGKNCQIIKPLPPAT